MYKNKYLKYKSKYLHLRNIKYNQFGGELPIILNVNAINLFTDPHMELYMNPIYGLVLCNTGYIPNIYWLNKNKFINLQLMPHLNQQSLTDLTKKGEFISKVCKDIPGTIQPSNVFMELKPIDYGRYIAIKYFNNKQQFFSINEMHKINMNSKLIRDINKMSLLTEYINKVRALFLILDDDLFTFHIILYCLCWVSNNDNGIADYYKGIKEVFDLLSNIKGINIPPLVLQRQEKTNSFEEIVVKTIQQEFKIYNQEWAQNFCNDKIKDKYPDCGEITALNLINLLIFNDFVFNITLLPLSSLPELVEFYSVFTTFNKISNIDYKPEIYCQQLNARDAWSYLIIKYAHNNLKLIRTCSKGNYKYELNAGLSIDNKTPNFLQLIKNLLGIKVWEDLVNVNIKNIQNNTKDGIGDINIQHNEYNSFIIHCKNGHYYMSKTENIEISVDISKLTLQQQNTINIIKKNIQPSIDNYLNINLSSELLEKTFISSSGELKKALFILSLTGKYDNDLRRRMCIDVDDVEFFNWITVNLSDNNKLEEYRYQSNDFKFIERMPQLKHLNSYIKDIKIKEIDLRPLSKLKSIGGMFLYNCQGLTSIDLRSLSNLESIGNEFLYGCSSLLTINLSSLSNLKSIGNEFLSNCRALASIDLSYLSKLESIGDFFLYGCNGLTIFNLSSLSKLESIGTYFMCECSGLSSVDLSLLSNLKSLGNYFMRECSGLTRINLSLLSKLESIGSGFLFRCSSLTIINLSSLSKLESIGEGFLFRCSGLTSIDLDSLSNIKSIGNYFMSECRGLRTIKLSSLSNLESIGSHFMVNCIALESINLHLLSNLKSIGNDFLSGCSHLMIIVLISLVNLESIGDQFLSECSSLESINFSYLRNLKSIGSFLLKNCRNLTRIRCNDQNYFLIQSKYSGNAELIKI